MKLASIKIPYIEDLDLGSRGSNITFQSQEYISNLQYTLQKFAPTNITYPTTDT